MQASLPDIGFKQLNAIVSLARFGSFIAAASYLGISQPGLTRIVQQAEKKLGAKLFIRSQRRVALTPAGEEFLPFAEHMVGELIKQAELIQTKQGSVRDEIEHRLFDVNFTCCATKSVSRIS